MIESKEIFTCLHPKQIINPYTHELITVPCGHCTACIVKKNNHQAMLCSLEESEHKFAMFVTLTYDDNYIPRFGCVVENGQVYRYTDCIENVLLDGITPFELSEYQKKINNLSVPYLEKSDLQLFLKRFRKNLSKYSDEKIRYYAVGEYGPVHFRPHFHIIFYFDEQKTFEAFRQTLFKSWTFGRVDFSLSRSGVASYVAKYVNSSVSCPRLLRAAQCLPFSTHSKHFACGFYQSKKKEIYKNAFGFADGFSRELNQKVTSVTPWRSLQSCFFPRCKGYVRKCSDERLRLNTLLYDLVGEKWQSVKVTDLARQIYRELVENIHVYAPRYSYILDDTTKAITSLRVIAYELGFTQRSGQILEHGKDCYIISEEGESIIKRIQSLLYNSKHFIKFVCDGNTSPKFMRERSFLIDEFYKHIDMSNLTRQYELQEKLSEEFGDVTVFLPLLYNCNKDVHFEVDMNKIPCYSDFITYCTFQLNKSIKHKRLNDLNKIFC